MEPIPSANARRSSEVETANFRRNHFSILCCTYIIGRIIMMGITMFFITKKVLEELEYPCHWMGFLTIHMILECSITYSDPLWYAECMKAAKIYVHWIFAVAALILGTVYFNLQGMTLSSDRSSNEIQPRGSWQCAYSYLLLTSILTIAFFTVFLTGIILFASIRLPLICIHRFHKYGGTLITYSMIIPLACNVFNWLSAPINWIILLLTIVAFILMPIRIFANRSLNT